MKISKPIFHILFWAGIYCLWILLFRRYSVPITKTITIEFCYLIFITSDYYVISYLIIPRLLHKRQYVLFVLATLSVVVISGWLRALLALEMNLHYFRPGAPIDFTTLFFNSVINISLWVMLVTIGKMLMDKVQTQQQIDLMEKERVKNELNFLKAQINPHALFNSLNTIYGHIEKSNQVARNILVHFSELLRYQLYDCTAEKVVLKKEVEYVSNYVAFQRLRNGENLIVELDIPNMEEDLAIAPLLLVVLIENAFKFVSHFSDKENRISVKLALEGTTLHSMVFNTKEVNPMPPAENSSGIGIVNLKRRLELLYPKKHEFTTNTGENFYSTNLIIHLA